MDLILQCQEWQNWVFTKLILVEGQWAMETRPSQSVWQFLQIGEIFCSFLCGVIFFFFEQVDRKNSGLIVPGTGLL